MKNGVHLRLLLVDDEQLILFAMASYFESKGFAVETAVSLEGALDLVAKERYDVAIVDLRLSPEADNQGMEVVRALHHRQPGCRTIVLTAFSFKEMRDEAARLGVAAFLKKPKRLPELLVLVLDLLQEASNPDATAAGGKLSAPDS